MQTLNNTDLALLSALAHWKLTARVLRLYSGGTVLFSPAIWPHLALMWNTYMGLIKEHKKNISRDMIAASLSEAVTSDRNMPDELKNKSDVILTRLVADDVPTQEEGTEFIAKVTKLALQRKVASDIQKGLDFDAIESSIVSAKRKINSIAEPDKSSKILYSPLKEIEDLAVYAPRIPTGINWLDEVTSGGGRESELWLILGPTGGGKTAITVQYACAQAMMGNATLWATYEQPAEGDIAERIISCVTDVSLDVIRDKGFKNLPEDVQSKYWASVQGAEDFLYMLDMTKLELAHDTDPKDNGGMYSVWQQYKDLKAHGVNIKTIIVDWFGAMMSLVSANTNKDLTNGYRFAAQAEIDIARKMAKEEKVFIIFLHQTNAEAQKMRPTSLPNKTVAADMKTMAYYMDMELILGNRDVHNVCWISNPKSRKGASIHKTIRLIGDKCRFVNAPGWVPDRDGNFYDKNENYMADSPPSDDSEGPQKFRREID